MGNKIDPIPDDMTIQEASEFWDTHSVADYPSSIVQFEYEPKERVTFVAIADDFLGELEKRAKKRGISIETLVNLWIQEKLAS
jgi:predicted DNA binding CopG/RHH family protein